MITLDRVVGALIVSVAAAVAAGGWLYAGIPRDLSNWVACIAVHAVAAVFAAVGVAIWKERI